MYIKLYTTLQSFFLSIFHSNFHCKSLYIVYILFSHFSYSFFLFIFHSIFDYIVYYINTYSFFDSFFSQFFTQNHIIYTIILLFYFIFLSQNFTQNHTYIKYLSPIFTPKKYIFHSRLISPKFLPSKKFSQSFFSVKKIKKEQHSDFATSPPHHYYPSSKWLSFLDQTG